jgi:hypothetical protein
VYSDSGFKEYERDIESMSEHARPDFHHKNGYTDMVIMSATTYEKMRLLSVYEKLMEAEDDVAEGRVTDAISSLQRMRAKYGL